MDFLDALHARIIPGDGAMKAALPEVSCAEELCASRPELVQKAHADFIAAGARLIRTNSFGANAVQLARHGCERRVSELNWAAAQIAKDAAKPAGAYVAGCVGPLGIARAEAGARGLDLHGIFTEQIGALLDGGCRIILLEGFPDLAELLIAINAKHALHHCPVIATLAGSTDFGAFDAAFHWLRDNGADVVGLAGSIAADVLKGLAHHEPLAAFPRSVSPADFAQQARSLAEAGVHLIGSQGGVAEVAAFCAAPRQDQGGAEVPSALKNH